MLVARCKQGYTLEDRRFITWCRRGIGAGFLVYASLNTVLTHWRPAGISGEIVAGSAGACFFFLLLCFAMMVTRARDEFGRALLLRSLLAGVTGTMFAVLVWGFVEAFSRTPVVHVPIVLVPAVLVLLTALAKLVVFRRYTSEPEL